MPRRSSNSDRRPAVSAFALAAALGATICAGAAPVAAQSFVVTGRSGSEVQYLPYASPPGILEALIQFQGTNIYGWADATLNGSYVQMSLSFTDGSFAATPTGGGAYSQALSGAGDFAFDDASFTKLGSGSLSGGAIYAKLGASTATIVLDVNNYSGAGVASGPLTGYLVLQGSTEIASSDGFIPGPVSLVASNPGCFGGSNCVQPYFDQFVLDWTATYQSSPYELQGSAVPEPSTWAMLLAGFAGLSFASWRCAKRRAAMA